MRTYEIPKKSIKWQVDIQPKSDQKNRLPKGPTESFIETAPNFW